MLLRPYYSSLETRVIHTKMDWLLQSVENIVKVFFFFFFPEVEGKGKHNSHAFSVFWLTCGNNIAHWGAYISFFSLYKIDGLIQN